MYDTLFHAPQALPAIPARFNGRCGLCETHILAGEEMIVKVDGDWVHATCADAEGHEVML